MYSMWKVKQLHISDTQKEDLVRIRLSLAKSEAYVDVKTQLRNVDNYLLKTIMVWKKVIND